MGLFTKRIEKHKLLLASAAIQMLAEDERVYRNHVALFASEYQHAELSAVGLLKARLHSAAFLAVAFMNRWADSKPDDCLEVCQMVSGLAVKREGELDTLAREATVSIGGPFFFEQLRLIQMELKEGPSILGTAGLTSEQLRELSTPGALQNLPKELGISDPTRLEAFLAQGPMEQSLTPGFQGLLNSCDEALIESVGSVAYDNCVWRFAIGRVVPEGIDAVKARARFTRMFTSAIFSRLRVLVEFQESLG